MKLRISLLFVMLLLVQGCSQKAYYMLSKPHVIADTPQRTALTIGVERVALPDYLKEGRIPVQRGNRIVYLDDALWAVDLEEDLTEALIFDLQKSLPESRVFHYPWERRGGVDVVVSVKINRFIAQDGFVYLDAVVQMGKTEKVVSRKEPIESPKAAEIVSAMQRAFFALEREVVALLDDIEVSKKR